MSIKFEGLDEVLKSLEKLADLDKLEGNLGTACALVERSAKQKAPKDTGELRRSITSEVSRNETEITGVVSTPLKYAPYVEYGTGLFATGEGGGRTDVPWAYRDEKTGELIFTYGQKAQPYMRPALEENREKIISILKEGLTNG